jgi:hypothetical protein
VGKSNAEASVFCLGIGRLFRDRSWNLWWRSLTSRWVIRIHWDFRGFGFTLQDLVQRSTFRSFLSIIFYAYSRFIDHVHSIVSSANILWLVLGVSESGKSLQYTRYR